MLQNAYLLAKIGADTAENERHFAENLPIGRRVAAQSGSSRARGTDVLQLRERGRGLRAPVRGIIVANFRQNFARFRLYRRRSLQVNTRFAAFVQNLSDYLAEFCEIWQNFANFLDCGRAEPREPDAGEVAA